MLIGKACDEEEMGKIVNIVQDKYPDSIMPITISSSHEGQDSELTCFVGNKLLSSGAFLFVLRN